MADDPISIENIFSNRQSPLHFFKSQNHFKWIILLAILFFLASSSYFIVAPTEMAGLRRLGTVVTEKPYGPGIHFKTPIDDIDTIQVSLSIFSLKDLTVYTIDNQWLKISLNVNYRIPEKAVMFLLYKVGRSGHFDVTDTVKPVIADRSLKIFAKRNTLKISEEREVISHEIQQSVGASLAEMFGLEIIDVQITQLEYSPVFSKSVEDAVKAKNDAVSAENTVRKIQFEADQTRAKASGEADAARTKAQGEADAIWMKAQAEAKSADIIGKAVAANPLVIQHILANKWTGQAPQTVMSGTAPAAPFINLK